MKDKITIIDIIFLTKDFVRLHDTQAIKNSNQLQDYFSHLDPFNCFTLALRHNKRCTVKMFMETCLCGGKLSIAFIVYVILCNLAIRVTVRENIKRLVAGYLNHKPHNILPM